LGGSLTAFPIIAIPAAADDVEVNRNLEQTRPY
jgi:hypothetical protein